MKYAELQNAGAEYRNALLVESFLSGARLHRIEKGLRVSGGGLFVLWLVSFVVTNVPFFIALAPSAVALVAGFSPAVTALFHLVLGLWLVCASLYGFYASSYLRDVTLMLREPGMTVRPLLRFEVAHVVSRGQGDPVLDFFASRFGIAAILRLGLSVEDVVSFLNARAAGGARADGEIKADPDNPIGLALLAEWLVRGDDGLRRFLASKAIDDSDFIGAASFVSRIEEQSKKYLRSWGRDALGRIPGIGKNWGYGETALLERYATEITLHPAFSALSGTFGTREAEDIERILSREREANVLLVGEEGVPKLAPLVRIARRIVAGTVLPPLEHKRMFVFDGALFASAMKEKGMFEGELTRLLLEAVRAGNIIFVFDHFETFFEEARVLGSDVLSVLDQFLASPDIQIAAIAELSAFHQVLEPNPKIKERFERVFVEGAGAIASIPLLEDEAVRLEAREGVFFTYPALRATALSAERYFFEGVMPDKAIDLLLELSPKAKTDGRRVITREDVLELVSRKTGIAAGEVKGEERTKLLRLEEILHERIVGQDDAIRAISGALRRARSGVGNPNRPLGSFLFLGPTGVGKTETTKALAQAFFGDEKQIMRFDMSEYQTPDALDRLIGTFAGGKAGVLASTLREHQYGVLLLDEFEKTNKDVHDLFLQILDEGFFTDASGKRVNARNLMIIATSNAGSDLIWTQIRGTDPSTTQAATGHGAERERGTHAEIKLNKDAIIAEIINRGIFKPEFLNRFDGVILFHPLDSEQVRVIARLQLQKLANRLEEKGLELVISDALLDYLVSVGQDPKFGARPMNRAIAEHIEQKIAEKLLRGEISAGSKVEFSPADLAVV